jgi:hypothetical protein
MPSFLFIVLSARLANDWTYFFGMFGVWQGTGEKTAGM